MLNSFIAYLTMSYMDLKVREDGQGLVEYALILVLVSIVSVAALQLLGTSISDVFGDITGELT